MMRPTAFFVFAALLTRTCLAELKIAALKPDPYSDLDDAAIKILTRCYGKRTTAIGFAGNSSDYLLKTILADTFIDVTLIGESRKMSNAVLSSKSMIQHKLSVFVISYEWQSTSIGFVEHLLDTFEPIRRSIWWNHLASYILILKLRSGCLWSHGVFYAFWKKSIINAKIICIDDDDVTAKIQLMTYNPYANLIPKPWELFYTVNFTQVSEPRSLFMYQQEYHNHETVCNQLDYDKTQNLGGTVIIIDFPLLSNKVIRETSNKSSHLAIVEESHIIRLILRTINARSKGIKFDKYYPRYQKPHIELFAGTHSLQGTAGSSRSYPISFVGGVFMSNFRGHKTQLEKILGVVDKTSQVATCLTLLVIMIFLKLVVDQALLPAFLNTVRIVCNVGFMNLPGNTSTRIFIGCVLSFVIVMQGIFQGDLASLLTTAIPNRNINTIQDVIDLGSNVYSKYAGTPILPRLKNFKGQIIRVDFRDCYLHLVNDSMGVCYGIHEMYMDEAIKHKLHISDERFRHVYSVKIMRKDWPLQSRLNKVIARIVETELVKPLRVRVLERSLSEFQYDDEVKANKIMSVMTLKHLAFAFVILGIGLACATVVFIGEIIVYRICTRVRTTRVQYFK